MNTELKVNKDSVPKSALAERPMLYDMEVFIGKNILTTLTVQATSDEDAVRKTAGQLKVNIRKRHATK